MSRRRRARIALAILGGTMLLALGYAASLWKRPTPIRIAFANSMTGLTSSAGTESLAAVKLVIDEVNRTGGVNGHPHRTRPVRRRQQRARSPAPTCKKLQTARASRCWGTSSAPSSLAAGQGYKAAGIPALTSASQADAVTVDNPYYFRAQTPVSMQGRSSAEYLSYVFKTPVVLLIYSRDSYGQSFLKGFSEGYDKDKLITRGFDVGPDLRGESVRTAVEAVASDPEPGIIVMGQPWIMPRRSSRRSDAAASRRP